MSQENKYVFKECVVIGAGISGIALGKWLKEYNVDFLIFEKSDDIAGLWRFREDGYGVMSFTHINVSKYNYCFSDFPYPDDTVEFMHHKHIYDYTKAYINENKFFDRIRFDHQVVSVEELNDEKLFNLSVNEFPTVKDHKRLWKLKVKDLKSNQELIYISAYVSVCTGHHGTPRYAEFPGQSSFKGEIIHSVKYKNAKLNNMVGKRVLLVGIGNSSVDVADNLVNEGGCSEVVISSRSGAWVFPTYINGFSADLYPNRFFLSLPYKVGSGIFETIISFISGHPNNYNLNPTCRILQTHPTVSATLMHHLQRKRVIIKPNIKQISGYEVTFENGDKASFDAIILCTGYKIDLDILHTDIKKEIFDDKEETQLNLFRLVFNPKFGSSLSFLGFVQPHSGGILSMSEIQARWFVYLIRNKTKLPSESEMRQEIKEYREKVSKRFIKSMRHTIQEDPITYNDKVTSLFGASPSYIKNFRIAWRLLFSSCGPCQWRLNGPDSLPGAEKIVSSVPVPTLSKATAVLLLFVFIFLALFFITNPFALILVGLGLMVFFLTKRN